MEKRIEKAIDIFLDAINKGTLAKGTCTACAVGNLVADGLNAKITKGTDFMGDVSFDCNKNNESWADLFCSGILNQSIHKDMLDDEDVILNIEATDFTWQELAEIEMAFESDTFISEHLYGKLPKKEIRADQIKGLEAVVKVMLTFNNDTETDVKEVFTKRAELIEL